jgi:hypothetical protein
LSAFADFCHVMTMFALLQYFATRLEGCLLDFDQLVAAAAENRLFKRFSFNPNHRLHQLVSQE